MYEEESKKSRTFEIAWALEKVLKRIEVIEAKVSELPQVQVQFSSRFSPTIAALTNFGGGTASQVSQVTGKSLALESKNLNELYTMELLSKQGQSRTKVFVLKQQNMLSAIEKERKTLDITIITA